MFPFAISMIVLVSGICVFYIPWYYKNVIIKPYHNFPEPVAKKLRRALFYSRGKWLDIREANKHFRQALALADELGMDPFSDEIMGVKYTIAALFEDAGYYSLAIDVLEIMRNDCQRWVDEFSDKHWTNGNRSRVKKNMVQINLKLGQLYDVRYVNEPENGEKRLVEAVESALKEQQRRESEGVKEGEGPWMNDEEMGGTLEALATHYEQFDSHYLATPLFVKALQLCPPNSCHGVVLMNNISTCLAQQTPPSSSAPTLSSAPTDFPVSNSAPRTLLIDQARTWATRALAHAAQIKAPDRTDECDVGCAVATHNLGEFLEMQGKTDEARQKYEEAITLSKKIKFAEGVNNAKMGIKRLKETGLKQSSWHDGQLQLTKDMGRPIKVPAPERLGLNTKFAREERYMSLAAGRQPAMGRAVTPV
ncbi:TPR 12 domain containing protein [Pyrenophora teres f. maculata]|nr:TPR 12 domain containing protein [Pyrenophora teres f. maculata]